MAFDPSVIGTIGDRITRPIADAPAKAMELGDLINREQISKLGLKQEQETQATYAAIKKETQGLDWSNPDEQPKIVSIFAKHDPKMAMSVLREFTAQQAGQLSLTREELMLHKDKHEIVTGAATGLYEEALKMRAQGKDDQTISATLLPAFTETMKSLKEQKLRNGKPVLSNEDLQQAQSLLAPGGNLVEGLGKLVASGEKSGQALNQHLDRFRGDKRDEAADRETKIQVIGGQPHNVLYKKSTGETIKDLGVTTTPAVAAAAASGGGDAKLSKEDYRFMAEQYLAGDKSVLQNLGRGVQGAHDIRMLRKEIADTAKEKGMQPADVAASMAEYQGLISGERALGTRMASIEQAAGEANKMIVLARESSKAVPRGKFLPWNQLVRGENVITNDPNYAKFAANTLAVINTWARAISPTGQPTIADKDHANAVISTAQSDEAYEAVMDQFQTEMLAALAAPADVKKAMHDRFVKQWQSPNPPSPSQNPAGAPPSAQGQGAGAGTSPELKAKTPPTAKNANGDVIHWNGSAWVTGVPNG